MKKQIEIKDNLVEYLKVSAAWGKKSFKAFIEHLLEEEAKKSYLFNKNNYEQKADKYFCQVIKLFKDIGIYETKMNFNNFIEGSFIYELKHNGTTHLIDVINDNMSFSKEMSLKEILEKTPFYLNYKKFKDWKKIEENFTFRISDTEEYKKRFGNGKDNK